MNCIEDYLNLWAEKSPTKPAVICDGETITYGQLWQQVTERSREYLQADDRTMIIRSTQSIDFLISYFASHFAGKAIVPLEEDCSEAKFNVIQQEIDACVIPANVSDILYTTGTTGHQKGIMMSHKAIIADAENLIHAMQLNVEPGAFLCNYKRTTQSYWQSEQDMAYHHGGSNPLHHTRDEGYEPVPECFPAPI